MVHLTAWYERNKKMLVFALACTFLWGLAAHGYCFLDNNVSHDSLREFHAAILGNGVKVGSGRFLTPIYRDLLGTDVTLPWLIGLLSLLWLGITVFFILKLFHVESKPLACLIAGILTTNIAVSSTAATYIHDLDSYCFAVMCATGAVLLWQRYDKGWLLGAIPLVITLGIYQSYLFVAVTLVAMVCILDLLEGKSFSQVFQNGVKAVAMTALGAMLYFLTLRGYLALTGKNLVTGDYNSMDLIGKLSLSDIPKLIVEAYSQTLYRIWNAYSSYPGILVKAATVLLLLAGIWALLAGMKKMGCKERILCILMVALLPLLMNFIYVITSGYTHDLMSWPTWLFYVLILLMCRRLNWQQVVCMVLVAGLLYGNVQFANGMYMKKDLEYDAYLSLMTRVSDRMETYEGYVIGQTPVVLAGIPWEGPARNRVIPGFKDYWNVTGMMKTDVVFAGGPSYYQAYFDYVLGTPILLAEASLWRDIEKSDFVKQLPCFPDRDCIAMYDGILVVKLGEYEE